MTEDTERAALVAELGVMRARLRAHAGQRADPDAAQASAEDVLAAQPGPSQLDGLCHGLALSAFERAVLLLAAGPELIASVAEELTAAHGAPRVSFGLAMALLPDAHWSAVTPRGPLRRWELLHLTDPASSTGSPLVCDERVLHHLMGVRYLAPDLAAITHPVTAPAALPGSLAEAAAAVGDSWRAGRIAVVHGPQEANLPVVTAAAAAESGLELHVAAVADLPTAPLDRDRLLRLAERESVLSRTAWAFDLDGARPDDAHSAVRALTSMDAPVALLGSADGVVSRATAVRVPRLDIDERVGVLGDALRASGAPTAEADIASAAGVFDLALPDLELAARDAAAGAPLWTACRGRSRSRYGAQARVVEPRADWDDLVLPEGHVEQLRALVAAVHHRTKVLRDWGFADGPGRGLGTAALFAGPSGTGKTLAAEVIANELRLDLIVVDLSHVVSKYIGETEKNLGRVFDAAEDGAAVLLFDEADTLFGKRTEVRDSHDRYANLEVGYMLQRMESFRGLAILTTNAKGALDQAFLRRLWVVVTFPYPDRSAREELWCKAFPARVPVDGLDLARLSAVDLPGGGIAGAALTAAYLGAEAEKVTGEQVLKATRWELAKNGRALGGR